ncbi:MAG TPA: spore germination protein [Bacillota bacterium]
MFKWKSKSKKVQKKEVKSNLTKVKQIPIHKDLSKNKRMIQQIIGSEPDLFKREFDIQLGQKTTVSLLIVGIGGLVDERPLRQQVVEPLLSKSLNGEKNLTASLKKKMYVQDIVEETNLYICIMQLFKGSAILLADGCNTALLINAEGSVERAIEEPSTETVVSGSREGFVEELDTNISLLRKRISHPNLHLHTYIIGEYSQTDVVIAYVEGIADPKIVERMHERIIQIKVDDISSSGQLEQYLAEHPHSIFPTTGNTERPDRLAAMMMEGRVALLTDGDPVALYYPHLFIETIHSVEDYSSKPYYTSFLRLLRFLSLIFSILLPSVYICAVNIHKEMIPSQFLIALEESREGVPFPLFLETMMLLILFEIVREAGVRMPRAIGQAVSIVGALILGEVSVAAGLISAQTIIIVAISTITTFLVTPVTEVVALLRLFYMIPSALFGFYGLMIGILATITHLVNIKTMGVPYFGPVAPIHLRDWRDFIIRVPYKNLKYRPKSIPHTRPIRYKNVPETPSREDYVE